MRSSKRIGILLRGNFLLVVHEFFRNGRLLKQFNHAAIALIPKSKHALETKDFRPISCCNVFYKTITKIIANKLAAVIPNIIDSAQGAFLEERLMSDNIMLTQHLIKRYDRKTSSPRSMLMVDIRKEFDSISWDFLLNLLPMLVFPPSMICWIKECTTTATCSISLNGKMHGFIKSKRGLREGDPLSPYLFVLAMEYLSRMIKAIAANQNFNYHLKCDKIGLTHLPFADDISRGDVESVSLLYYTLVQFGKFSGLKLNLSKSQIFNAGVPNAEILEMQYITSFSLGEFPVRYLGTPLVYGKMKACHFTPLLERIASFINAWSTHSLSYAGILELVKVVIQGVKCFWIQDYPISFKYH